MLVVRTAPVPIHFAIHSWANMHLLLCNNNYNRVDTILVLYLRYTRSEIYQAPQLVERVATASNFGAIDARFNCSAYNCRRGGCIDDKGAKPHFQPPSMHFPATHGHGFNEYFY